jgi:hypothetical protein
MKRVISIALLLLMTAVSVQPTLALHFCGGKFHSLRLNGNDANCCPHVEADRALPQNNRHPLFNATNICCADYVIDASTDDFQQQEITVHVISPSLSAFLPADEGVLRSADNLPLCRYIFPPDHRLAHSADLFVQFCIFLI